MKISAEAAQVVPRATTDENEQDPAFASLLSGATESADEESSLSGVHRRELVSDEDGAEAEPSETVPDFDAELDLTAETDGVFLAREATRPARTVYARAVGAPAAPSTQPTTEARMQFDVHLFERQSAQPQNDAVVPGPRTKPQLSRLEAALPETLPSGPAPTSKAESKALKQALRAPALPEVALEQSKDRVQPTAVERTASVRRAPASPPMSVSLQLATIAHDVLARAAQLATSDTQAPFEPPPAAVTLRPPAQAAASSAQDAFIHIDHPVLGRIRLQLQLEARTLRVRAVASNAAAVAALRESEEDMRDDVSRHGVELTRLRVDLRGPQPQRREK